MTEDRLKAGVEALRTGDRRKARRLLGQVVNEDPDNPTAWWYLAAVLETTEQKIHSLQQVLRLHPDHEQARQLLERLEKRQVKTRPAHTLPPVVDAAPDQHGELAIPKPDELGDMEPTQQVSDSVVAVIAVSIALLAILLTALLAWSGIGAGFLGIQQGPDPEPTRPPLVFDTPACSLISSELARIVFINNSGVDVEILVGETGAERSLTVIGAGEQVEVGTTPGISVRFLVKPVDELSDVTRGAARIEVPQGSICRVPIHE